MKKLALITAISAVSAPAFARDVHYALDMFSGTAADPLAGMISTAVAGPMNAWYVDRSSGSASNKSTPARQLQTFARWTFDFTNPAAVPFTGVLYMGDYAVQTVLGDFINADGRQTFTNATLTFSGVGIYDEATHTFTYDFMNPVVNGGGASVFSSTGTTCLNGQTSPLGKVCAAFQSVTNAWEGLALNFVFAKDWYSFVGTLRGTNTGGTGLNRFTTTINWQTELPVPGAAWLFGSALLGTAGMRRRRRSSCP